MTKTEGPAAVWSILSLPHAFLRTQADTGGPELVPGSDWVAARDWAIAQRDSGSFAGRSPRGTQAPSPRPPSRRSPRSPPFSAGSLALL
eukprot:4048439-Prymnesium_polylepis.1